MILMISRKVLEAQKFDARKMVRLGSKRNYGNKNKGKKLGIIGMGRIGSAVAKRLKVLGMEIHYHNRKKLPKKVEKKI